ncbi:META domain-containing protein [Paracoccus aerodenitrificans]|uniref:META domain-containing protein n=1 Tax=Paracoccus aerodenitrificans TaxID=3017781 RepID=UPI0022F0CA89|nr:META domain-containing protein [Paracoccus aerodenitrificans]WBU64501.1 META domain-containing protein [Paracoccus aerodenitrificans]
MKAVSVASIILLTACSAGLPPEERLDGIDWKLMQVNSMPWVYDVSLRLDGDRLSGVLPCNAYSGARAGTAPAFGALDLEVTEMACADPGRVEAEAEYLAHLARAIAIEREGGLMILTGPDTELIFEPREARGDEVF